MYVHPESVPPLTPKITKPTPDKRIAKSLLRQEHVDSLLLGRFDMISRFGKHCITAVIFAGLALATVRDGFAAEKIQFNRDIRPILSENCYKCHGPDDGARKAT